MLKRRIVLTLCATLAAAAVSASAVIRFYPGRLADPETADRAGLLGWIVTRDLSREDPRLVRILVRRLDEEFGQGNVDWEAAGRRLNASHKQQLNDNIRLLIGPWFEEKTDRYLGLADAERTAYLDRTIDAIRQWRAAESLCRTGAGQDRSTAAQIGAFSRQLEVWKQGLAPQRRGQIDQFVLALQGRWLERTLFGRRDAE